MLDSLSRRMQFHARGCVEEMVRALSDSLNVADIQCIRSGSAAIEAKMELEFKAAFEKEILSKVSSELASKIRGDRRVRGGGLDGDFLRMFGELSSRTSHASGPNSGISEEFSESTASYPVLNQVRQQRMQQDLLQVMLAQELSNSPRGDDMSSLSSNQMMPGQGNRLLSDPYMQPSPRNSPGTVPGHSSHDRGPNSAGLSFVNLGAELPEAFVSHSGSNLTAMYSDEGKGGAVPGFSLMGQDSNALHSVYGNMGSYDDSGITLQMGNVSLFSPPPPPPRNSGPAATGHHVRGYGMDMDTKVKQHQQMKQQQMRMLLLQQQQQMDIAKNSSPPSLSISGVTSIVGASSESRFNSSPELQLLAGDAALPSVNSGLMMEQQQSSRGGTASYLVPSETGEVNSLGQPCYIQKQLPARFAVLPMVVQHQILLLIAACPCITVGDFDEKVLQKMVMLKEYFGENECIAFLDCMAGRMRNKHCLMKNGPGYLDVAVCGHMDMLKARGTCSANASIQQYAQHVLSEGVYEQLVSMVLSSSCLSWGHLDRGHIHALSKLPADIVPQRLAELSKRSYKNVENIQGCIMSVLNARPREGQGKVLGRACTT